MAASETASYAVTRHSTCALASPQQFDCFCDAIAATYAGIQPQRFGGSGFDADYRAVRLGRADLARLDAPAHRARRGAALLATRPDDSLFINLSPFQDYQAELDGQSLTARAGQPLLLDNSQAFRLSFTAAPRMRLHSLRLPRTALGERLTPARIAWLNRAFSVDPLGRLAARQLRLLVEAAELENWPLADRMSEVVLPLLQQLVEVDSGSDGDVAELAWIKEVAQAYLRDPDFSLAGLADHFGCSDRTLQNRFAQAGETFSGWLISERLERVRQNLADPALLGRSTEQLAYGWGFRDASHFRRRFKQRYGLAPQAYRRRQLQY